MTETPMPLPAMAQAPTSVPPAVLLANHLKALKLPTFVREYEKVAFEAAQDRADYPRYLLRLCELERIDRERRMVERRIRMAKFPHTKSFDTFDFAAQPSLNKTLALALSPGVAAPAKSASILRNFSRSLSSAVMGQTSIGDIGAPRLLGLTLPRD